ncbi:hypothetical protein [Phytoactinopolyspora mesophila]|uniref:hypothetical protein n=1 Tax=Phytoactinopolyspora mesophila TaxID=2650750 RepID=UPI0031B5E82A
MKDRAPIGCKPLEECGLAYASSAPHHRRPTVGARPPPFQLGKLYGSVDEAHDKILTNSYVTDNLETDRSVSFTIVGYAFVGFCSGDDGKASP